MQLRRYGGKLPPAVDVATRDVSLGFDLTARLREVLADRPATESELRGLAEEADAWRRALEAQIHASERRVEELSADPAGSLAPIASELQRIEALRPELTEVTSLHEELERRARELRTEWLLRQAESLPRSRRL
jgi:LPS sulfotransferase NodH